MQKGVFKIIFALLLPVVMILTAGFFSFNETSIALASVPGKTDENPGGDQHEGGGSSSGGTVASDGLGGLIYVGNKSSFNMTNGSLSGGNAKNGGGVYVSSGGTFNLSGGTIMGNVASAKGSQVYNDGTFTMTGGTIGQKSYLTRVDENGVKNANGNYALFGSYPQTIKASDVTIDETNVDANGYYLGSDDEWYAKIRVKSAKARYFTDATEIVGGNDYYFKVKPIMWQIAKIENGKALLVSKDIIEGHDYGYNNGYYGSGVRSWLNGDFYNEAFSAQEKEYIETSTIDCETSSGREAGNDKIYLLSRSEASSFDIILSKVANDVARINGTNVNAYGEIATFKGGWLCRDTYDIEENMYDTVLYTGDVSYDYYSTNGIVPALLVNIGDSSGTSLNGIYNTGVLNIYGGTVYDDIFSSSTIKTKVGASINGIINLSTSGKIIVLDYAGETPNYTICVDNSRTAGILATFKGVFTAPDISKINVYGYNANSMKVVLKESKSSFWVLELIEDSFDLPNDWATQLKSTTYMTTTVTPANLTSIKFVSTIPSGYTQIGTLSTGLPVYKGTTATEIAFVAEKIYAPVDSYHLFESLSKLTTIDTSVFDTTKAKSMSYMFDGCTSLTTVDLSNFNTLNVTSMYRMFYDCKSLTNIDVSNFSTKKVTTMHCMFKNCSSLTGLDLNNFDTSNVIYMDSMFSDCSSLTSLDVRGFNTSNVKDMSHMFFQCSKLTSLDVSNFNTSNVTNMNGMFYSCSSLTSLDVSKFDTSKVTGMSHMFFQCSSLTSLDVSKFVTSKVTDMSAMFGMCKKLESMDVSNFDTSNVTNMSQIFNNCSSLTSLDVSSFDMSKVTSYSYMFNFGSSNKIATLKTPFNNTAELPITTGSTLYNSDTFEVVSNIPAKTSSSLTYVSTFGPVYFPRDWKTQIASTNYMTTTINYATLTNVTFENNAPSGYSKIGTLSTGIGVYANGTTRIAFVYSGTIKSPVNSYALFKGLVKLENITFNNFNTSETTDMSYMFFLSSAESMSAVPGKVIIDEYNSTLQYLDLSIFDTSKVTDMGYMFCGNIGLKTLNLSSFNMERVDNVLQMLNLYSADLQEIKLPYNNKESITIEVGSTLVDASGNTVTSIPINNVQGLSYTKPKNKIQITFVIEGRNVSGGLISIYDKNGNKLVYFDSPESFEYTYNNGYGTTSSYGMKQVGKTIKVDEGTTWYDILNEYGLVCTDTVKVLSYGSVYGSTWTTDQMKNLGKYWNQTEDNPTFNKDITLIFYCEHTCMSSDTEIDVYDEKRKKRIRKKLRDISYKDKLLVWNFDKGCFDLATPLFITKPQTTTRYTMVWFSDGSSLRLVGADDTRRHRVFCLETGKFEYVGNGAKVGMTTYNDKGEFVKITKIEFINEKIEFMNIITNEHFNCFANGILTSCKLSNMYPIKNMKYDKTNKTLNTRDMFGDISDFYYKALRLAEQPLLNIYNDHSEYIDYKQIYEIEWENSSFKRDEK